MATLEKQLRDLIDRQRPQVQRAFRLAIRDVVSRVTLNQVTMALRRGDVEAAIDALGVNRAAFGPLKQSLDATYATAGTTAAAGTVWQFPTGQVRFRFDLANPRANAFITEYSSNLVTNIAEDSRDALRVAIRAGYEHGRGPLDIARDLTGRIGPNGRRTGGIVGLNEPQARAVQSMRSRLASGDPVEMRKVLGMSRRDQRLDGVIRRAISEGRPVSQSDINRLAGRYSDRLLALRGETIARTETAAAVENARYDSFRMGMDEGGIPDWAIEKTWLHGGGRKDPRDDHVAFSGTKVQGLNTPFTLPDGTQMQYPHDTSLGAGAKHVANCTCRARMEVRWDLIDQRETARGRVGELV